MSKYLTCTIQPQSDIHISTNEQFGKLRWKKYMSSQCVWVCALAFVNGAQVTCLELQ